jgi:hypothetical protein
LGIGDYHDLTNSFPRRVFVALRCLADENSEQIHAVPIPLYAIVRTAADRVAAGNQKLDKNAYRVCLGMRTDRARDRARQPVERGRIEDWPFGRRELPVISSTRATPQSGASSRDTT